MPTPSRLRARRRSFISSFVRQGNKPWFASQLDLCLERLEDRSLLSGNTFVPGNLLVSSSDYTGTASSVTVGQSLPGGGNAVANGSYLGVWANEGPDGSFGVTSPILLQQITPSGTAVGTPINLTTALGGSVPLGKRRRTREHLERASDRARAPDT